MIKKIIFGLLLVFAISLKGQSKKAPLSYETKVKNYVLWFESLPDHKKREESRILVMKLNNMSPYDRGMWLATSAKYEKNKDKPPVKEVLIDSLTNEGVKKKLYEEIAKSVEAKIDTIKILSSSIGKDRTIASNAKIRKKIADWKFVIAESRKKQDSMSKMPRDINDYKAYNAHQRLIESFAERAEEGEREIILFRDDLIVYNEDSKYGPNYWNSYLIDEYEVEVYISVPHKLTNEELDSGISSGVKFDKHKINYFAKFDRGFKDGNRWDEYSHIYLQLLNQDED
jgi:hypothetical protein